MANFIQIIHNNYLERLLSKNHSIQLILSKLNHL